MLEKSRLEELSLELPEKERRILLERIGRRMEKEESEEAIPVELKQDEREKIIIAEMRKSSAWMRFVVWLTTLVSGRPRQDVFVALRLRRIRSRIRSVSPGLTGFETRDLTARFARKLYDLFLKTLPLSETYRAFAADKAMRGAAYSWYVEERSDDPRRGIDDFLPEGEMEEIYAQTGQSEDIRKKLALRLNDYVRALPESLFSKLEEEARLHLFLGKLVSFPFASFFRYFNAVLAEPADVRYPPFESAPVMLTLDLMEKLYVALSLIRSCAPDYVYAEEPISFYLAACSGVTLGAGGGAPRGGAAGGGAPEGRVPEPAGAPAAPGAKAAPGATSAPGTAPAPNMDSAAGGAGRRDGELARMRSDVMDLAREIESFESVIPLLDLLRFFRRDPWYALIFNAPRLYLRSLYFGALKTRLAVQLDERLGAVKERVIGRKLEDLLRGQRLVELAYYRESPDLDLGSLSLPSFACNRSLTLVYNFLLQHFTGAMQEAAQLVASTVLANNRILQTRLAQNMAGLEDLEARIVAFDRTLSPDEDDGRQLARFRATVATDLVIQKSYRAFLQQKDREARELIEKAREYLSGVRRILDEIRTSVFDSTRSLLKTLHVYRGRNQTLGQVLNGRSETMGTFLKLLDQLLELEKGL